MLPNYSKNREEAIQTPVSYTHLDVYKRQVLDRTFNYNNKRAKELLNLFREYQDICFHLEIHPALWDRRIALPAPGALRHDGRTLINPTGLQSDSRQHRKQNTG